MPLSSFPEDKTKSFRRGSVRRSTQDVRQPSLRPLSSSSFSRRYEPHSPQLDRLSGPTLWGLLEGRALASPSKRASPRKRSPCLANEQDLSKRQSTHRNRHNQTPSFLSGSSEESQTASDARSVESDTDSEEDTTNISNISKQTAQPHRRTRRTSQSSEYLPEVPEDLPRRHSQSSEYVPTDLEAGAEDSSDTDSAEDFSEYFKMSNMAETPALKKASPVGNDSNFKTPIAENEQAAQRNDASPQSANDVVAQKKRNTSQHLGEISMEPDIKKFKVEPGAVAELGTAKGSSKEMPIDLSESDSDPEGALLAHPLQKREVRDSKLLGINLGSISGMFSKKAKETSGKRASNAGGEDTATTSGTRFARSASRNLGQYQLEQSLNGQGAQKSRIQALEEELAKVNQDRAAAIEALEQGHEAALRKAKADSYAAMEVMTRDHVQVLDQVRRGQQVQMQQAKHEYECELAKVRQEADKTIQELLKSSKNEEEGEVGKVNQAYLKALQDQTAAQAKEIEAKKDDILTANVRSIYLKTKTRYERLLGASNAIAQDCVHMDLPAFGSFGQHMRALKRVVEEQEREDE
ncbi:hypothetical protein BU23DRAFT_559921 [Bimuria novae-zelandiae CBS 107.79]|uniref:Uncharacterized protein n=1 Tax=Bimuria novae-zelandiae CBS 107.79 TaxID=1447943 RepID=A0A6A5UQS3_9PLEO|nr:hypothetical protein BU23DRAFT_559921 [Bimuria novae-zelandiae CBS 107.79]